MTEDEARQKWCPMVRAIRVDIDNKASRNRLIGARDQLEHSRCIGSACMMWRHERSETAYTGNQVIAQGSNGMRHITQEKIKVNHGYCGLAGK